MHKIYLSIPNVFTVRRAFIYFLRLVDNIQSIVSATAPCVKEKELDFPRKGAPGNKSHAQINLLFFQFFFVTYLNIYSSNFFLVWIQQCWHSFKPGPIPPPVFESQSVGLAFHIQNSFSVSILSRDGSGETHLLRKPPDRLGRFGNKGKHLDQEKQQKTVEGKEIFPYFADSITPTTS